MGHFLSYHSGGCYLSQEYQPSNSLQYNTLVPEAVKYEWEDRHRVLMGKQRCSIPYPGMYKNRPCFYGGLHPYKEPKFAENELLIFNSKLRYEIVDYHAIRKPTDREYKVLFETFFETFSVVIQSRIRSKTDNELEDSPAFDRSYIVLLRNSYKTFIEDLENGQEN